MKTVQVGHSRLYSASGCSLAGRDEVRLRFTFESICVVAYIGPKPRHIVPGFRIGPVESIEAEDSNRASRAREYELPSPDKFPADLYTELIAIEAIEVDEALAEAFHGREGAARDEILHKAKERESRFATALDYVAGVLGLRLHHLLVRTPIAEQCFAYRNEGDPYAFSTSLRIKFMPAHEWDVSDEGLAVIKAGMPQLQREWTWEKAAGVLAWLLRAWSAEDPFLEFVSLFIPLEQVIPSLQTVGGSEWKRKRRKVLAILKKEALARDREELSKFVANLKPPSPSLASRFEKWATALAVQSKEDDLRAFRRFNEMRNSLLHAGKTGAKSRMTVESDDLRALEDIAARYVSLALFGDANVYQMPKRTTKAQRPWKSPLDVEGVDAGLSAGEIVSAIEDRRQVEPHPVTDLEDLVGCADYNGEARSLEAMDAGIAKGARKHSSGRSEKRLR